MAPPGIQGVPSLVGRTVGSYRIESLIGQGGMGQVYRAHDEKLNRTVAVKALPDAFTSDPRARKRFLRETRMASRVIHPYVATVFDVAEEDDRLFLVMEHIEGRTLDRVITEDHPDHQEVTRIGVEVAEALSAIHAEGLVHRDLKPRNVMIDASGHAKVMDFGVARQSDSPPVPSSMDGTRTLEEPLTGEGEGVGTVIYMSPEQVRGGAVDHRSDLFALGTLLYEVYTGEHPFLRQTVLETASAILNDPPGGGREPESLTSAGTVRQVVYRLLEKEPERRYQDTATLVGDLRALSRGEVLAPERLVSPRSSRLPWYAATVALVLVVAAVATWRFWPRPPPVAATRPMVAALPFEDRTGEGEALLRGEMLADLLAADLGESSRLRALQSERVLEILGGLPSGTSRTRQVAAVMQAAPVAWVLAGELWREGDLYQASVDVYRKGEEAPTASFRVAAAGTAALMDLATRKVFGSLFPGNPQPGEDDPEAARLSSPSEEARLLEYRARQAIRDYRFNEAIELLERALEIDPRFLAARVRLAAVLDRSGYGRRAREVADQALRLVERPGSAATPRLALEARAVHARIHEDLAAEQEYRRELARRYRDEPHLQRDLAWSLVLGGGGADEALGVVGRAVTLDRHDPRPYLLRARVLRGLGRHDEALASLDRARDLFEELQSKGGLAEVEQHRGHVEFYRGRFVEAATHYTAAAAQFSRAGLEALAATAERAAGDAEISQGHLAAAEEHYRSALATARATGQYRNLIGALNGFGGKLYLAGRIEQAEPLLREALEEARRMDNPRLLFWPVLNLAGLLQYTGRVGEGRGLAEEGLAAARAAGHPQGETRALALLADAEFKLGNLEEAAQSFREIIELQRSPTGVKDALGRRLASLAEVLLAMGSTEDALAALDEAISLLREQDRRVDLGYTLLLRAQARGQFGLWEEAQSDLEEARRIATDASGVLEDLLPRVDLFQGMQAMMRGDWSGAERSLAVARRAAAKSEAITLVMPTLVASCETALARGKTRQALDWCREALGHAGASAVARTMARVHLARVLARTGAAGEAAREVRQALEEAERMGAPLVAALAAWALVSLPEPPVDAGDIEARGRSALETYLKGAPVDRREAVRARPDLIELVERLDPAAGPVSGAGGH